MAKKSIGALWKNRTRRGKEYFTGVIEIGDKKIPIIVFTNDYKEKDKQPDYKIFFKEKREVPKSVIVDDETGDELPF